MEKVQKSLDNHKWQISITPSLPFCVKLHFFFKNFKYSDICVFIHSVHIYWESIMCQSLWFLVEIQWWSWLPGVFSLVEETDINYRRNKFSITMWSLWKTGGSGVLRGYIRDNWSTKKGHLRICSWSGAWTEIWRMIKHWFNSGIEGRVLQAAQIAFSKSGSRSAPAKYEDLKKHYGDWSIQSERKCSSECSWKVR